MLIRPATPTPTPTPTAPPRGPGRHAAMQLATTKRAILRIARPVPVCVRGSAAYCKAAKIARSARAGGPTTAAGVLRDPADREAPPRQLHRRAERVGGEPGALRQHLLYRRSPRSHDPRGDPSRDAARRAARWGSTTRPSR